MPCESQEPGGPGPKTSPAVLTVDDDEEEEGGLLSLAGEEEEATTILLFRRVVGRRDGLRCRGWALIGAADRGRTTRCCWMFELLEKHLIVLAVAGVREEATSIVSKKKEGKKNSEYSQQWRSFFYFFPSDSVG